VIFGDFFNTIAPHLPFAIAVAIGSVGWIPVLRRNPRGRRSSADCGLSSGTS